MLGFVRCLVCGVTLHGSARINFLYLGGFTVLSTKAISTLLTTNGFNMFEQWVTYPVLAVSRCGHDYTCMHLAASAQVLIGTGVGQIRYLNRALMRFDSKVSGHKVDPVSNVTHRRSLSRHNLSFSICLQF